MVSVIERVLTIEQANALTEEDLLKLKMDGCRLVYLTNNAVIVREQIYQPKFKKRKEDINDTNNH